MKAEEIKSASNHALQEQQDHLNECIPYFYWKMGTVPWCNNPKLVNGYQDLANKCQEELKVIEKELSSRSELITK